MPCYFPGVNQAPPSMITLSPITVFSWQDQVPAEMTFRRHAEQPLVKIQATSPRALDPLKNNVTQTVQKCQVALLQPPSPGMLKCRRLAEEVCGCTLLISNSVP
jgi:hypothetical protein